MTIKEVFKSHLKKGVSEDKASEICLGILTSGLIDATDTETFSKIKKDFINKIKGV